MNECKIYNIVKIVTGSYKLFTVTLLDEDTTERIDLSLVTDGKIIIKTGAGAFVEKAISTPITDPKLGVIEIELLAVDTILLDKDTVSFEIEVTRDSKTEIYLGENLLEVKERLKTI